MPPQKTSDDRRARSALISEAFGQYMQALIDFFAAVDRCAAKGWPDRKAELGAAKKAQQLYRDQELARLRHVLAVDSDAALDSYTDIAPIVRRLREDWTAQDEETLVAADACYKLTQEAIATMRLLTTELDGPIEMAKRDPELRTAYEHYRRAVRALQSRLYHATSQSTDGPNAAG